MNKLYNNEISLKFYELTNRCSYMQSILFHCQVHFTYFGCFIYPSSGVQFLTVPTATGTNHSIVSATYSQRGLQAVNFITLLGSLYMFRVFYTPIIRSTIFNCIYSHWYKSQYRLSYLLPAWPAGSQFYSTARFTLHVSGVLHTHHQQYNF